MKVINRYSVIGFIIGAILFSGISIHAYKLYASQVGFTPTDETWNVSAVDTALNSLYDMAYTGDATSSDILSGKSALVQGRVVNGSLTIPNYTTLSDSESVGAGASSTVRTGYYYLDNYNVSCGTTTCPNYTNLSGTQNVGAGSSSTLLNGYYNLTNYKVSCGGYSSCSSCCSCPSCNSCCPSVSKGTTTTSTSSTVSVNCGFRPSFVAYVVGTTRIVMYNSNLYTDKAYDNNSGWINMPRTSSAMMYSIDSSGFTIAKDTSSRTVYWICG